MAFFGTLICALPFGWVLSLIRVSKSKILNKVIEMYCWLFRGTPLLLQIAFVFYGLPFLGPGITLDRMTAAFVALILNYSAYFAEIFRGGIESIDQGQYEAADMLGLSRLQLMTRIILPQAFKRTLPSTGNEIISLIKDTALVYTIGIAEMLRVASIAVTRDFRIEPFFVAGILYLIMTFIITKLLNTIEKKFNYYS